MPTGRVLAGFAPITPANRWVVVQEWLAEAITMWGITALVIVVTATGGDTSQAAWVYQLAAGLLVALAVLTGLTGARAPVIWFKICPVLLTASAALLVAPASRDAGFAAEVVAGSGQAEDEGPWSPHRIRASVGT